MTTVVTFDDPAATEHSLVGGKGANLGRLTTAGFAVPPGFTITTTAYSAFLDAADLAGRIAALAGAIDFADHRSVEAQTAEIRALINGSGVPADLEAEIGKAAATLGVNGGVAVRSSGTAEDLADASFAGLHDTFLGVQAEGLIDAVRRCWASLWTPRAASYRQTKGFDHGEAQMAVVVQQMIDADVSGVAFTANPLTGATDELVIDASWGLGEAVVAGAVTPDHWVFRMEQLYTESVAHYGATQNRPVGTVLRLKDKTLGSKEIRIVRAPTGRDTVTEAVPDDRRAAYCLADDHAREVAELARRVAAHYDELPQDIEFAVADGRLYLLQSRPITGVTLSWDEDVDSWQIVPDPPETVWTRVMMDEGWTGAITPLMYSFRAQAFSAGWHFLLPYIGRRDLKSVRLMKYSKGEAYCNTELEKAIILTGPPTSRPAVLPRLPEDQRPEVLAAPWSWRDYAKTLVRFHVMLGRQGSLWGHFKNTQDYLDNRVEEAKGLPDDQMCALSDGELKQYIEKMASFETEYAIACVCPGWFIYVRDVMSFLAFMVMAWYDGDNPNALLELITGCPRPTAALQENVELRELAQALRARPAVLAAFEVGDGADFFAGLDATSEGAEFLALCQAFVDRNGHRGHADRDIYFPRYADDWGLLYRSIEVHLKVDDDPMEHLAANNARRDEVAADVAANLSRKPLGILRAEVFKLALDYSLKFLELRDNERYYVDYSTYAIRKAFLEMNRRLVERGLVDSERDFWFLTKYELYDLLDGKGNRRLLGAKVAGRRKNFDLFDSKEVTPPKFLRGDGVTVAGSAVVELGDGRTGFQGVPTSRGVVEGTARLVKHLAEIDRVNPGEIAIVNSTDPGWTALFAVIGGIIAETGGMLSHFASLAREHGMPAAQLEQALRLIPDGARISLDGNTGQIVILDAGQAADGGPSGGEPAAVGAAAQ